jgi:hypothetical protein
LTGKSQPLLQKSEFEYLAGKEKDRALGLFFSPPSLLLHHFLLSIVFLFIILSE